MGVQVKNGGSLLAPGLSIIHSNHLEDLRRVAVQWIRNHPLNPLENELFVVQSNGMAQWIKLALAENDGCGISAALDIQLPARFLWNAYRAVLGANEIPRDSPFDKTRLIWRLLRLLPSLLEDGRFVQLARFLSDDTDLRKRHQLAYHLADLFDQYQVYRADWLADWTRGVDALRDAKGAVVELPEEQMWQAELWRQILADVPEDKRGTSRSALHRRFITSVETMAQRPAGLPRRVIVFGISSLPKQALDALHAVSRHSQVLLFVHNPCRHYWAEIIEDRELLRIERARHGRKSEMLADLDPDLLHQHVNPLLAAWGKQGRDYIGLLYGYDRPEVYRDNFAEIDLFSDFLGADGEGTLLQQVQQRILDLAPLPSPDEGKCLVSMADRSIDFQLAHSRQREVEILQDQLLFLFEEIPDLKPRDIIVMTPDIDCYGSHIEAVFGNIPADDPRYIPYTIADRPERASVSLLNALEKLLRLPDSRMAVSDLMDLMEVPAFRERFGLAVGDLPRLHRWIEGAGVRWGLSGEQRESFGLPAGLEQNTWIFGLRRMLLGYAAGSGESWEGIEPYDEVGGLEAALVGPLSVMLEKLEKHWRELGRPAGAAVWCGRIRDLVKDCFLPTGSADQLTQSRLEAVLDGWLDACTEAGLDEALTLPVIRETVMGAMNDSSISQRFLAGKVNLGTLMPMRAIPFKVVCLLGMNDGEYPRSRSPLDFDLLAGPGRYRPGDRSRREDDRYLFLEALLSAREKLYISYIGRSVRDNSACVPSVLVGQLRDYLAAGWRVEGDESGHEKSGEHLLDMLTCQHPLQPFSRRYFKPAAMPEIFTYAHEWREVLDKADAGAGEKPLGPPVFEGSLTLMHLTRFLKNPVQSFFNQRLKVYFDDVDMTTLDLEPFALDRLSSFGLGNQLLSAGLAAEDGQSVEAVERQAQRMRRTGELPLGGFGELAAEELAEPVRRMLDAHGRLAAQWPYPVAGMEIRLKCDSDRGSPVQLEDWLDGLRSSEPEAGFSKTRHYARWEFYFGNIMDKVSRRHPLINPWIKHLAGCARGIRLTSYLVAPDGVAALRPLKSDAATGWIFDIIGHWWIGLEMPLPVTAKTALAYLGILLHPNAKDTQEITEQKAREAARKAYQGNGYNSFGELGYSPYLERVYVDFETLFAAKKGRFKDLAGRLYRPLIETLEEAR